jgi:glycosyltransferase involved in cell wall biosynthesis
MDSAAARRHSTKGEAKMKACTVAYTFYEADNRVRRYAEALAKRGDEVDAFALRREGQLSFEVIRGVRVHRIQKRRRNERGPISYLGKLLLFFFRSMWLLSIQSLRQRYDIIHVHSVPDFQVFATLIPRMMGTPVILDIHDIVPEFYASKFKVGDRSIIFRLLVVMERVSMAYSNFVIVSNHLWETKLTARSVPREKCTTIINYPDLSIFHMRPKPPASSGEFLMCYPGTLNRHQGLDVAIRAMSLLRDKAPNVKFLIIGDGPDREKLKTMVHQEQLEDRVAIQGFVPLETIAEIIATVSLGVVPKLKDSFGNEAFSTKIMEFMAMGVPVVASDTRIDQYYFNHDLVQFFESGSAKDLADKILDLVHDPAKRGRLCANAKAYIGQNNWDVRKREYLDLVDRLIMECVSAKRCAPAPPLS